MRALRVFKLIMTHPLTRKARLEAAWRYLRWQIGSRLAPGPILVDFVEPMCLLVSPGMHGATHNYYCGLLEFEDMAFALHLLREKDLFVDIGANIGSYTILASAAKANVIAFEPGERYDDLLRNIAVNRLDITCHKAAVGAKQGTVRYTVGLDCINRAAIDGETFVEVPLVRLDDAIPLSPTLIKVDVEGYEAEVIAGGQKTFSNALAIIMEINGQTARYGHDESEVLSQMKDWGFILTGYDPFTRSLKPPSAGGNKIFIRGDVTERLRTAPRYRVGNHLI